MTFTRSIQLNAVVGLFLALAWTFVSLRIYVKTVLRRAWGEDDALLLVALVFYSAYAAASLSGIKNGTGLHLDEIPLSDIPKALYYWWLCEIFYTVTTVFLRLSIAVFLLRIATKPLYRGIIYATLATVVAFSTFYLFLVIFQCHPVSFFWKLYEGEAGSCLNPAVVPDASIAHSAISFTADWILGLLPIFLVHNLQMSRRIKISVAGILSLGLLAGIATIIRIPYIRVLALTDDFLYATTSVAICSTIEPGLGLVAAGAVTLRPLIKTFLASTNRSCSRSRSRGSMRLSSMIIPSCARSQRIMSPDAQLGPLKDGSGSGSSSGKTQDGSNGGKGKIPASVTVTERNGTRWGWDEQGSEVPSPEEGDGVNPFMDKHDASFGFR